MALGLRTVQNEGRVTVLVRGSIDLHSSERLREHLLALVESGARDICVDLSRVDFCDSSGLNVLVRAYKTARARRVGLSLTGAHNRVLQVLQTTGLDRFLIIDSPDGQREEERDRDGVEKT